MGLFGLISNTVEGVAEATINTGKSVVGTATAIVDNGKTIQEGLEGVEKGLSKIGDSESKDTST